MSMQSINPASGEKGRTYETQSWTQVEAELENSHRTFSSWRQSGFAQRRGLLQQAARILEKEKGELARLMSLEMGKPVLQARAEIEKCAAVCGHYAENAEKMLSPEAVISGSETGYVRFDPLGTILAIMPWNFPFWQVFRFAAPALMAGNVCLLKHSSNVPGCAQAIGKIFRQAGFPEHVFTTLLIGPDLVEPLIDHRWLDAVTMSGSEAAGRRVAELAGRHLKKMVLELGGSDPFIVLADAPLEKCLATAVNARMINTGQSCIAAKRFIVEAPILDEGNDVGPLARADLVDELERQVRGSVDRGARILVGGKRLGDRPGYYFQPTVLGDVAPGMPAYDEELFGPVAALIGAADAAEALRIANDTPFGLGASIWTQDRAVGERMAATIEAGMVFINGMVRSDPRLPFGGIKNSGYGRELSAYGIKEFVNIKTVVIG
ncbi:MAG: NAD-dependent succinate-semialdehyde dehydrogenase [Candidatus Aminicenantes bacterium]|nr:NAD-dependent succinate-semialdehyde dehydrogenase [Candidatus Aminicenantes bacterium]